MFETYSPSTLRDAIELELQHDENLKTAAITAMKRLKEDPEYYIKKYGVLAMTKASEKAGHKYYKRVPKPTGKGYYYFYTQKEFKDYQKEQIKPEEKTGKFNLLTTIKGLFGFSDERQSKEKIKDDYKANAIGERFSISLDSWASHLSEYFRNKDKWVAFFSKKKEEKEKAAAGKKKSGEKKEKAERPKSIIKLSLMKAIHEMYGGVKPVEKEENADISVMTEEEYLATHGASRQDIGESALHKNRGGASDKAWRKIVDAQAKKDNELLDKREKLRKEYKGEIESGEIREPSRIEKLIATANGNPDLESTHAARRILEKQGLKWDGSEPSETPEQKKMDSVASKAINEATPENRFEKEREMTGSEKTDEDTIESPKVEFSPKETTLTIPFHRGGGQQEFKVLDYTSVIPKDIYLVKDKAILDSIKPGYIPIIDEDFFRYANNMIVVYKLEEDKYIISTNAKRSGYTMRGFETSGNESYSIVNRDVLAATQDYYLKLAKAKVKAENEKLAIEYPNNKRMRKSAVRMLKENKMSYPQLDLLKSFLGNISNHDKNAWSNYKEMMSDLKQKTEDMEIQLEEYYNTYTKGHETSYGDVGTKDNLLDNYGVKVKRQNGDEISEEEIGEIKGALDNLFLVYGNRSSMAKNFGLKISHSGEKFMHARKAAGLFVPSMRAIGVTAQYGSGGTGFILAHEWGHFMDYYLGEKDNRHYASDNPEHVAGQIASRFRKNMAEKQKSIYQNRTCECFARAMEQYWSIKTNNREIMAGWDKGNHPTEEVFKSEIMPLIDQFFEKHNNMLKAFVKTTGKMFIFRRK